MKLVTVLAAALLLTIAAAHGYRAYTDLEITVAHHVVPIWASWVCAGVLGFLGLMLLVQLLVDVPRK
ncbi:MAG: hypothetical protein KGJ79_18085 [Alphaproteobacteria bacterium]|nr:hypothetical protein [Alphaproteobacteria bacterium]MDE2493669.1 hypothetical protein [Alphaproteobacteria bacterium]